MYNIHDEVAYGHCMKCLQHKLKWDKHSKPFHFSNTWIHEMGIPMDKNNTSLVIINDGTETGVVNLYDTSFDRLTFNVSDVFKSSY